MNKYKIFGYYFCDNCGHWFKTGCFLPGEKEDPEARRLYDDICPKCGALVEEWYQCFPWYREYLKNKKYQKLYKMVVDFLDNTKTPTEIRYSRFVSDLTLWINHQFGTLHWKRLGELYIGYKWGKVYMIKLKDADTIISNISDLDLLEIKRALLRYVLTLKKGNL